MIILGIETSCDETAAAVVENGQKILSNVVASSAEIHAKTGGIIPENAARQQIKSIIPVLHKSLNKAKIKYQALDAIAVTIGPGLIGSLLVGVETAKTLSYLWEKPIVPVNHLVGHLYANWLESKPPKFPAIGMVVSGGHTDIVLMKGHGKLEYLGGTRDDAAGEAFDKIARLLDIPYPGGPQLSKIADEYRKQNPNVKLNMFPRPMLDSKDFDMSFSGLKTAVLNKTKKKLDKERFAAEAQEAIVEVLISKIMSVVNKYRPASILLAGGVSANNFLRECLADAFENPRLRSLHIPDIHLCTDNAAYIASAAYYNYKPIAWQNIISHPGLKITD